MDEELAKKRAPMAVGTDCFVVMVKQNYLNGTKTSYCDASRGCCSTTRASESNFDIKRTSPPRFHLDIVQNVDEVP